MHLPRLRPRLRLRTLLIAVVVLAAAMGSGSELWRRHNRYRVLADRYASPIAIVRPGQILTARQRWHLAMWQKYDRAAHFPWLPVGPDSPPPE